MITFVEVTIEFVIIAIYLRIFTVYDVIR